MTACVLNKRHATFAERKQAVYVGRGSPWGNPFRIGVDGDRGTVIDAYTAWLRRQEMLLSNLDILTDRDLMCWCAPLPCHADLLLKLAAMSPEQLQAWKDSV